MATGKATQLYSKEIKKEFNLLGVIFIVVRRRVAYFINEAADP
jgi:hypothetical protein